MEIAGLQKLTLLDFPGKVACTVFLSGCNFRCPFCHNAPLLKPTQTLSEDDLLRFLRTRRGLLDGVAVTGGEPLLSSGIEGLLREIKALGFRTKLDTNGSFPDRLEALLREGVVDFVAMDIKNAPKKYADTIGRAEMPEGVRRSAALLMAGDTPYEFRTTVVDELHEPEDFIAVGQWLAGAKQYFLQCYKDSENVLRRGLHAPSREKLERCRQTLAQYIPNVQIRGL